MSDIILRDNKKKENKEIEKKEELNVNDLIKGLVDSQTVMNYAFAGFKTETEKKFNEVNSKLDEHDILIKRKIQLAPNEAKNVRDKVKQKVKAICEAEGLDYHEYKSRIFPRVYKAINDKNHVASYRELPSFHFEEIIQDIELLEVYVKDLKEIA